jgi:tripartite-type tricarboxylate transporter receptor subunit TctC
MGALRGIGAVLSVFAVLGIGAASAPRAAAADAVADFYAGKKIVVIVGSDAGGGYDAIARMMARHIGRHIPGNPTLVVQNMPGAASFTAANNLYNTAPKDGTALGAIQHTILTANVTHQAGARFDVEKFAWIGNLAKDVTLFISWHTARVKTAEQMLSQEILMGGAGQTSAAEVQMRMFNALIGTHIKVISGYPGQAQIQLAMQRGEVEGMGPWSWSNLQTHHDLLDDHKVNFLLQAGVLERTRILPDVPTPFEFIKSSEDRQVMQLYYLQEVAARPVLAPPGVPADRLAAIRAAFMALGQDEAFRADADKAHVPADPSSNVDIERVVRQINETPPNIVERLGKLVSG